MCRLWLLLVFDWDHFTKPWNSLRTTWMLVMKYASMYCIIVLPVNPLHLSYERFFKVAYFKKDWEKLVDWWRKQVMDMLYLINWSWAKHENGIICRQVFIMASAGLWLRSFHIALKQLEDYLKTGNQIYFSKLYICFACKPFDFK